MKPCDVTGLGVDDGVRRKRADDHDHRQDGNDERQFVADHLGDRAHGAEHGKLVVAPPARHENRQLRGRPDREEKQDAAID